MLEMVPSEVSEFESLELGKDISSSLPSEGLKTMWKYWFSMFAISDGLLAEVITPSG
jgi:hypothetical protein